MKKTNSFFFTFLLFVVSFSFSAFLYAEKTYSVFSPILGYSLSNTLKVSGSVGGQRYSGNRATSGALVLGFEGVRIFPINENYQWGLAISASYEMNRSLKAFYFFGGDDSTDSASDEKGNPSSSFSILNIDFSGRFYVDEGVYFFGGLSFPQFISDDKSWGRSGEIAFIGGLGWVFSEMVIMEVQYRPYQFSAEKNKKGVHFQQDEKFSGFRVSFKFPLIVL